MCRGSWTMQMVQCMLAYMRVPQCFSMQYTTAPCNVYLKDIHRSWTKTRHAQVAMAAWAWSVRQTIVCCSAALMPMPMQVFCMLALIMVYIYLNQVVKTAVGPVKLCSVVIILHLDIAAAYGDFIPAAVRSIRPVRLMVLGKYNHTRLLSDSLNSSLIYVSWASYN